MGAVQPVYAHGDVAEVSIQPVNVMWGAMDVQGLYFVTGEIGVGARLMVWKPTLGGEKVSYTIVEPLARYYLKIGDPDISPAFGKGAFFGQAGFYQVDIVVGSAKGSMSGPAVGAGYNLTLDNHISFDAGYELVLVSNVKINGKDYGSAGFGASYILRVGYAF
ncbi:MAG: hypothetical protein OEW12_01280 [Deltaproteobacteria bacterium]|nr:hypothetical protein [Deltaproteobacteria bacterium]